MSTTEPTRTTRRLAAIVVADVVGYSRQMSNDDVGTLDRLRSLRAEILDPAMREHGGRIVKLMGDGILAEFGSAVSATQWAVSVQQAIAARNERLDEDAAAEAATGRATDHRMDHQMILRIGVNIGDVILEGDDIFGDGVNVAARLEPLSPKGGVCISAAVHDHVRGKVTVEFVSRGERALKNIAQPVAIWCWSPQGLDDEPVSLPVPQRGRKPSLSVRPFEATGSNADAASLSEAVHDATVVALSNLSGITMLTDAGRADFLASGTFQVVGQRYRATIRLVDNRSGQQFWSERFDGDLEEVFDAQDELAFRISTALRYSIYDREVEESERTPASERTTEMLFARVGQTMAGAHREEWADAGPILDALLATDPGNSGAHALKACWHLHEVFYGWREISPEDCNAAALAGRESVRCNERSDFAHVAMSQVHLYAQGDTERARREAERALQLSPYYVVGRYLLGLALLFGGDAEEGLSHCAAAAKVSSRVVVHYRILQAAALAAFLCGRHEEAVDYATRADHLMHDVAPTLLILAAAASAAGHRGEARSAASRIQSLFPDFRLGEMRRWPFRREADHERFVAALRASGLPD